MKVLLDLPRIQWYAGQVTPCTRQTHELGEFNQRVRISQPKFYDHSRTIREAKRSLIDCCDSKYLQASLSCLAV